MSERIPDALPKIAPPVSLATERKPVDVLAVWDRIQKQADEYPFTPVGHVIEHNVGADRFREARAAVAELIDAAAKVAATLEMPTLVKQSGKNENAGFIDMRDWFALAADVRNLRAALARVGGAA